MSRADETHPGRAREIQDPQVLIPSLSVSIPIAAASGDVDQSRELMAELEGVASGGGTWIPSALLMGIDAFVELDREALERLAALAERRFPFTDRCLDASLGVIDQLHERHDEAVLRLAGAISGFELLGCPVQANQCRIIEARSRLEIDDRENALALLRDAEAFFAPIGGSHFLDAIEAIRTEVAA